MALADDVEWGEIGVVLALVAGIGYALYKAGGAFQQWWDTMFGITSANAPSYSAALSTTVKDPIGTVAAIAGADQGGSSATNLNPNLVIPGTGQTVTQLMAAGYSEDDINTMLVTAAKDPSDYGGAPTVSSDQTVSPSTDQSSFWNWLP
jgi:hypothetical protein